ncbi:MAG TPA: M28 family peptidase [Pyrinomonadaceae bacterium]|nr:M28 family peptidase [Pyrinomonadaceae bacterium]
MLRINKALLAIAIFVAAATAFAQSAAKAPESKLFDAGKLIEDIRTLSADDMEGRSADRPSITKAREYIKKRFVEVGLTPTEQSFDIRVRGQEAPAKGINFVATVEGKMKPAEYIVVTAHYDHLGVRNGVVFNGADDNASGTAALFALASYFKKHQPDHSLIFVALDAEERGLVGARYFVANPPVPKESIILNVNMDMISRNDKGELYASGSRAYPQLKPALEKVQKTARVKLLLGHDDPSTGRDDWTSQSDQAAFHAARIPFIYFGVEDHKDYHKSTDDFANIQPEFYIKAVETILESIVAFDKELK